MSTLARILEDLKARRLDEDHLDRIERRIDLARGDDRSLEKELIEEMAGALTRVTRRLTDALARLAEAGAALDAASAGAPGAAARAPLVAEFNRRRETAVHARWELIVQRESLGLTRHQDVDAHYPVPPRRR